MCIEAIAIARRTAVGARLAFPLQSQLGLIVDAGRNIHLASDFLLHESRAAAGVAGVADRLAAAVAGRAGGLQGKDPGATAPPVPCRRSSDKFRAACPAWPPCRGTFRRATCRMKRTIFDVPWAASNRSRVTSQRMSPPLRMRAERPRPPPKKSPKNPSPRMSPKALMISETSWKCGRQPPSSPAIPEAIISGPLLRVAEDLERLGRLFELRYRLVIARVAVGMIPHRQFSVGFGDLGVRGAAVHAPKLRNNRVFPPSSPWPGWGTMLRILHCNAILRLV